MLKCLVWDLDRTLWEGALPEGGAAALRPGAAEVLARLDARGVLHSIASRNDAAVALRRLAELGIAHYFVAPQLGYGDKSASITRIAAHLSMAADAIGFVDDDPYERDEVRHRLPAVTVFDGCRLADLLRDPQLNCGVPSNDAAQRRPLVQRELRRRDDESRFAGTAEEFRAALRLRMSVRPAADGDLIRLAELTVRTNQLNSTGVLLSVDELAVLVGSLDHELLVVELTDRYGDYGRVGLSMAELSDEHYTLQLLLFSCRVLSRGVAPLFLQHLLRTRQPARRVRVELVPRPQNRPMQLLVRLTGFTEIARRDGRALFEHHGDTPDLPHWVNLADASVGPYSD